MTNTEARGRRMIVVGALLAAVGVGLSGSMAPMLGGVFLISGWLGLVGGIHSFGRAGSDA